MLTTILSHLLQQLQTSSWDPFIQLFSFSLFQCICLCTDFTLECHENIHLVLQSMSQITRLSNLCCIQSHLLTAITQCKHSWFTPKPFQSHTFFLLWQKWVYQSVQWHLGLTHPYNFLTFGHSGTQSWMWVRSVWLWTLWRVTDTTGLERVKNVYLQ